jgi:hypothetical protein
VSGEGCCAWRRWRCSCFWWSTCSSCRFPMHSHFKDQALENRQERFRVRAPRGRITDRDGEPFWPTTCSSRTSPSPPVRLRPAANPTPPCVQLLTWFDLPPAETLANLRRPNDVDVAAAGCHADPRSEHAAAGGGGGASAAVARCPHRVAAAAAVPAWRALDAHVIGYTGEVDQEDLDGARSRPGLSHRGTVIGKQGVESAFETGLRGRTGLKLEEVNASGRIVGRAIAVGATGGARAATWR